ncbi:hypothetical protein M5689_025302 [Euphorbia peplus]|nr:hypothetical protein M5689_025302 [Euphorbia peplus]
MKKSQQKAFCNFGDKKSILHPILIKAILLGENVGLEEMKVATADGNNEQSADLKSKSIDRRNCKNKEWPAAMRTGGARDGDGYRV